MVVEVGRYGWSKLDQIGRWLVHGRLIVAMVRPSERGTGWASVGEPRDGPASCPPPREVGPQVDTRQRAIQLCRLNCPETPFRSRSGFLWKDALSSPRAQPRARSRMTAARPKKAEKDWDRSTNDAGRRIRRRLEGLRHCGPAPVRAGAPLNTHTGVRHPRILIPALVRRDERASSRARYFQHPRH